MNLKRIIIGIVFLVIGVIVLLTLHAKAVDFGSNLTQWQTYLGQYGQALVDTHSMLPILVSILFIICGTIMLLIEYSKQK